MGSYLEYWVTHSVTHSLIVILLVAFLESLALVGLILPGALIMASLGTLIGSGQIGLLPAWGAGIIGCLLGDWISYFLGRGFKAPLHHWSFMQRYHTLLSRTERALNQHSIMTVLFGRLIGPMRPLVPMVAGMLNLPPHKFALPNIMGCLIWPPIYFFPGILAGVAINIPSGESTTQFKGLLLASFMLCLLAGWFCWRWLRPRGIREGRSRSVITPITLRLLSVIFLVAALICCLILVKQPLLLVYWQRLLPIFHL